MSRALDVMHLGRDRVICAHEVDGLIVDPGPASTLERLLEALGGTEPRALLLTHIHLDHAGASGALVRRFPGLQVYVHEIGAPHVVDPSKLLKSARRLYGEDMDRLWGPVDPVPEGNVHALAGGERVEGMRVEHTPGHAAHHVAYLHEDSGEAFVGDVGGVRIPPSDLAIAPTPPPDIDLEAWTRSLDVIEGWSPTALCLTHFGRHDDVGEHIDTLRERMRAWSDLAHEGVREMFVDAISDEIRADTDAETAARYEQAAPPDQLWQGLERYWRKRAQAAAGGAA